MRAEQPGGERLRRAAQLRPGQGDGPGSALDGDVPVSVTGTGAGIVAGRRPLVAVAAEELGDLRFQRCLQQQLRAKAGDVLQDLREFLVLSE